nr:hypothetical protein [Tanacetum cinerariifolium]
MENNNVIAPGMFRIDPRKTSRKENFVPNKPNKISVKTNPITVSQPHVIIKKAVNSDSKGDCDLWSIRMEQYLTHTNYALWEVIMNGDALASIAPAKSTLLLAIPDEHLLKFHGIKDAKTLWEAIKTRFRGNKESKKMHKTILKQQYENFVASRSEGDSRGSVAMLTMRVKRFIKKTGRNLNFNGKETVGFDKTKVEFYNFHRKGHFVREYREPKSQGNRNGDNTRRIIPVETPANALVVTDGMGYDWSYQAEEGPTNFALMTFSPLGSSSSDTKVRDNSITELKNQLEESLKEKDDLNLKLEKFETSSRNLTNLINSQLSFKDKTGIDYDSQLNERDLNNKSDMFESESDSSVNKSEENNNQANDRYKAGEGLADSVFESAISETITSVHETETSTSKTSKESMEKPKTVRPNASIIKYWKSDSDYDCKVPVNTTKQSSPRATSSTSTARYVNTAATGPTMNVSAIQGNEENAVKSLACWIWRPTGNVIDHISKNSGSYILKRFNYTDLQGRLKHMMGNKSFLTDYQEIDKGFVAFKGSPKGGRGPEWLFDIDSLTNSMNYEPVTARNQTNNDAGIEINANAGKAGQEKASDHEYILLPFMPSKKTDSSTQDVDIVEPSINTASTNINTSSLNIIIVGSNDPIVSPIPTIRMHKDHPKEQIIGDLNLTTQTRRMLNFSEENAMVFRNKKDERGIVVRNKAKLVAQGYTQEEGINYDEVFAHVARIEAIRIFLAYASFMGFIVYQMDVKSAFRYGKIEEEVYVCQPPGFEDLHFPNKTTGTSMEPNKTLIKDAEAKDVDVHLYRLMIGSLMYLTASRLDIMFVVCACARFQVTLKTSHLHDVKRIFRCLKGQPKLGLWYPRDSPFDLEAFSYSDDAGASLDRKSTTGAYLERTDGNAEFHQIVYFFTSSMIHYALTQIHAKVDGKTVVISESSVRSDLHFNDKDCITCLSDDEIFENLVLIVTPLFDTMLEPTVVEGVDEKVVRAATTAASLEAKHESDAQTRFETTSKQSYDPPLLEVNTFESREDSMEHQDDLTDFVPPTPHDSPLSGGHIPGSDEDLVIKRLKKKVKILEKKQRARNPGMKLFKISTSKKKTLDKENDVNAAEPVSTTGDTVNAASVIPDVSAVGPFISTTEEFFEDEITTMTDTIMAIRRTRPRTTSVVIHGVKEEPRRATPPPTVQSQDKEQVQFEREQRTAREKSTEQEAKDAALIKQIKYVQARIDADALLAERLQQKEREQFTVDEQARIQDITDLYRLVKERNETTSPEGYDLLLWGDLITLFEPSEEDVIWKAQQDYNLIRWRLFDSCGVHVLLMDTRIAIHMLVERKYPLTRNIVKDVE